MSAVSGVMYLLNSAQVVSISCESMGHSMKIALLHMVMRDRILCTYQLFLGAGGGQTTPRKLTEQSHPWGRDLTDNCILPVGKLTTPGRIDNCFFFNFLKFYTPSNLDKAIWLL